MRSDNLIDHDFIAAIDLKSLNWPAFKPVHHLLACPGSDIAILARNSDEQRPGRDAHGRRRIWGCGYLRQFLHGQRKQVMHVLAYVADLGRATGRIA